MSAVELLKRIDQAVTKGKIKLPRTAFLVVVGGTTLWISPEARAYQPSPALKLVQDFDTVRDSGGPACKMVIDPGALERLVKAPGIGMVVKLAKEGAFTVSDNSKAIELALVLKKLAESETSS